MRLDDPLHPLEVARQQPLQRLRIHRLPERRRADHVAEQHRHDLPVRAVRHESRLEQGRIGSTRGVRADRPPPSRPRAGHRELPARHRRRAGALRLRPLDDDRRAEGRARRPRPRADRRPPPPAQPHPPRPRRRRGRPRPRAPGAAGARLADRRAAPRRPVPAGEERAPALRRHVRLALGRARAGAAGERPPGRRHACSGSSRSRRRATPRTTSATSTPTGRSTPATRAACASCPAASSCRRRRRPRSTSRRGRRRSTRSSAALPSGSRSIHFGVADDVGRHLTELRLTLDRLGRVGRGRRDRGGVRRVRARRARRLGRGRRRVRPGDAALAVVPRPQALGREAGAACLPTRSASRSGHGRPASPSAIPPALLGARDLVRRDVPRADRGRLRDPRQRRRRDRGRPRLRRLDARAGGDARARRRRRRPGAAARSSWSAPTSRAQPCARRWESSSSRATPRSGS